MRENFPRELFRYCSLVPSRSMRSTSSADIRSNFPPKRWCAMLPLFIRFLTCCSEQCHRLASVAGENAFGIGSGCKVLSSKSARSSGLQASPINIEPSVSKRTATPFSFAISAAARISSEDHLPNICGIFNLRSASSFLNASYSGAPFMDIVAAESITGLGFRPRCLLRLRSRLHRGGAKMHSNIRVIAPTRYWVRRRLSGTPVALLRRRITFWVKKVIGFREKVVVY